MTVRQTGERPDDVGHMPPMPGQMPVVPMRDTVARRYYASTLVSSFTIVALDLFQQDSRLHCRVKLDQHK